MYLLQLVSKWSWAALFCLLGIFPRVRERGRGTPDFKWQEWSNGGKNQTKKIPRASNKPPQNPKIPRPNIIPPKNSMPNFQTLISRKSFKWYNKKKNLQIVLNTQTNPLFNQATPKNPGIENFKPPNTEKHDILMTKVRQKWGIL